MKKVQDLTITDFILNPLWTWVENDNDESFVMPLPVSQVLPVDYDAIFILCDLYLADQTKTYGILSVRIRDHKPYLLSFVDYKGHLFDVPLQNRLRSFVNQKQIEHLLQKPIDKIFPLKYVTSYRFENSPIISGRISINQNNHDKQLFISCDESL